MRMVLSHRQTMLNCFLWVQLQDGVIVIKYFLFLEFSEVLRGSKQIISNLDDFIVVINVTINKAIEHTQLSTYQLWVFNFSMKQQFILFSVIFQINYLQQLFLPTNDLAKHDKNSL